MNLQTLRVVCSIVEHHSFARAAAVHKISQPAATQCVQRAEDHFGVPLFDRRKRPLVLTPAGEVCYQALRRILELYDDLENRLRAMGSEIAGRVHVAAIYSVGLYGLADVMRLFMRNYPKAEVRLEYLPPDRIYEAVLEGSSDLGVVSYPSASTGLAVVPLYCERMLLACPPDHPLARQGEISLAALEGQEFIGFDRGLPIRKEIDRYLRRRHVSVQTVIDFDNIETIKHGVEIGMGVSILPEPTLRREVGSGALAAIRLRDFDLSRPIGLVHKRRKALTPAAIRFIELAKQMSAGRLAEAG